MALTLKDITEKTKDKWIPLIRKEIEEIIGKEMADKLTDKDVLDIWQLIEK